MQPGRLEKLNPKRVAVLRALQLGDMLCAIPSLRALRRALPEAHITLVGLPWSAELRSRFPNYIDDVLVVPGYPGLPEQPPPDRTAQEQFFSDAARRGFDLAIQLHGSGEITNGLAASLGAPHVAGFVPAGTAARSDLFMPYPDTVPEVQRLLALMEFLGAPVDDERLEFPLFASDRTALAAIPEFAAVGGVVHACVHAGARARSRRWPPARFAAIADALAARGLAVVLTGTADERDVVASVREQTTASFVNLCGRTTLGALAAAVSTARIVVCNDTGVSHLADALRTPSVIIADRREVPRWAPLDSERHRVVAGEPVEAIPLETVLREVHDMLDREAVAAL